jgi:hypothetical protein
MNNRLIYVPILALAVLSLAFTPIEYEFKNSIKWPDDHPEVNDDRTVEYWYKQGELYLLNKEISDDLQAARSG